MTQRLSALVLLTIASLTQTNEVSHQIPLKVVEVGGTFTLTCPVSMKDGIFFYWYKQPLGRMLQIVATASSTEQKLSEQFNNNRFKLTEGDSQYYLTLKNVTKDDEATYLCHSGTAYFQSFSAGIYVAINDRNKQRLTHVKQTPETTSVQEGDTVTLQCSLLPESKESSSHCPSDYNVYWFRVGFGESHPSIIYTHKNSNDAQNRSCVYQLYRTIQNSSDTGIYYCAVVTSEKILFGEGTKVETVSKLSPV
ncbi:hypothetical protein ATANTOWER_019019, partial [Ataeniobius toweri]|nr:hypothetical protein [Ataeniobius toweri]